MPNNLRGAGQGDPKGAEEPKSRNSEKREKEEEEKSLDKTIEDSFPASDPPSSIPDPDENQENVA